VNQNQLPGKSELATTVAMAVFTGVKQKRIPLKPKLALEAIATVLYF